MALFQANLPTGSKNNVSPMHGNPREWAQGRRALIVEDETLVAWHLEALLQELGFEVSEILSTGRAAITEALTNEPDIIFMDVNLADEMDGVEAARKILEKLDIPLVFVTAYSGDSAQLMRMHSVPGKTVVIGKPATPAAIEAAILSFQSP